MRNILLTALGVLALSAPAIRAADLPRPAPDFAIQLTGGKQVSLSQYKGKVVAVVFLLTSCPHCQKTVQCLIRNQKELGPRGFQAVGSAIEDMARIKVPEFTRVYNPNFPIGFNDVRAALDFMQYPPMAPPYMPLIAFIDREGVVQAQFGGRDPFLTEPNLEKNIRAKILELLDQPVSTTRKRLNAKRN